MGKLLAGKKQDQLTADIAAFVERELRKAPPLQPWQLGVIARALRGDIVHDIPTPPSEHELEQRRKVETQAAAIKEAERMAAKIMACDACNLSPDAHRYQKNYGGVGFHEWVPGRAQRILAGQ